MSSPTLTLDELLAEVERVHGNQPQGVSVKQLCATTGHNRDWVRMTLLQPAITAGRARFVGRRREPRIDGAMALVPVYAFATDAVARRRIKGHERGGTKPRAA